MLWYGGSIAEAVNLSKQRNAIFVVFVEDGKDTSKEMLATINSANIVKRLSDEANFLAIKLESGSENYVHFARLYHFVPVPSLFFIGHNGVPLEVVCHGVQADNLGERIDKILDEHKRGVQPTPSSSQTAMRETTQLLQSEAQNSAPIRTRENTEAPAGPAPKVQKTQDEYEIVCHGDVCTRVPKGASSSKQQSSSHQSSSPEQQKVQEETKMEQDVAQKAAEDDEAKKKLEEELKKERAKKLIEARKLEKEEKEKQLEKERELERRATGRSVAELKRWQADQELKQLQEERKREKLATELSRQRVLEQIAQDRAERRAREMAATVTAPVTVTPPVNTSPGDTGNRARLQFKLPDGTSHSSNFAAEDTLGEVRSYVSQYLNTTPSRVSIWTALPRRELVEDSSNLRDLGLVPSAALLVMEVQAASDRVVASSSAVFAFFTALLTTLVEPLRLMYDWIVNRLTSDTGNSNTATSGSGAGNTGRSTSGHFAGAGNTTGTDEGRSNAAPGMRYRPRSNVHSLRGDNNRSSDEDNNTWNGNSTQQM